MLARQYWASKRSAPLAPASSTSTSQSNDPSACRASGHSVAMSFSMKSSAWPLTRAVASSGVSPSTSSSTPQKYAIVFTPALGAQDSRGIRWLMSQ